MKYLFITLTLLTFTKNVHSQSMLDLDDSVRFHNLLDTVKITGIVDSNQYKDVRLAGILYMHQLEYKQAKPFLDLSYNFYKEDSVTNTLLYEALIMKINVQKDPISNINDIMSYRAKYTFLKDSLLLHEIAYNDALKIMINSFEEGNLKTINKYYDIAMIEFSNTKDKSKLLNIENTEVMFFNVALKNYLKKNTSKASQILKTGNQYFPKNKEINDLIKYIKERK